MEICRLNLPFNTNSLEFCKTNVDHLACGMYELDENLGRRIGCVKILKLVTSNNGSNFMDINLMESSGVFEMKWLPDKPILITALADGSCKYLNFGDFVDQKSILNENFRVADKMLLNLDVFYNSNDNYSILFSDNQGSLHLAEFNESGFTILNQWVAHSSTLNSIYPEIWTCCFDKSASGQIIFSGAENGQLKIFDLRSANHFEAQLTKNVCHDAGVTCISCHPNNTNQILTGGYDDFLKIWDKRNMKRHIDGINLGGGVWRIKFHPDKASRLLCSCMYNGWSVVDLDSNDKFTLSTMENYEDGLLYGVDWCPKFANRFVSCTFYDKLLRFVEIKD